jgi:hypothetical protein
MPSQDNVNEMVKFFFTLQLINKLYHWNTESHARHLATDRFNGELTSIIDKFVEVLIGRHKMKPIINTIRINETYLSDDGIVILFEEARNYLNQMGKYINDSDLLNIRDELLAEVNKTLYLFRLK